MKSYKIKLLTGAITMSMVFPALSGCANRRVLQTPLAEGTKVQETGTQEMKKNVEPAKDTDPFGKYKPALKLHGALNGTSGMTFIPGNPDYDSAEKNLFITDYKKMLGIDVVYDWVSADADAYNTKWNMAMAQGNLPDFGAVDQTQYKMLLKAGLIRDMKSVYEKYASPKYKEFVKDEDNFSMNYLMQDGKMYGLPITGTQPDRIPLIFIRKDWLKKLNLAVPKTIDELEKVAEAFVANKMGGKGTYGLVGCKQAFGEDLSFRGFFNGYGAYPGTWIKKDGKLILGSTADAMKKPLLELQKLYKKGAINEDFAVTDPNIAKEDVASGKVGIAYGAFYLASGTNDAVQADPNADWVIAEVPTEDGSKGVVSSPVNRNTYLFVSKKCKHPEAVVKLLNLQIDRIYNEDPDIVTKHTTHQVDGKEMQPSKYVATGLYCQMPWQNLGICQDVTNALKTGKEEWTVPISKSKYELAKQYEAGDRKQWGQYNIFGPTGTFSVVANVQKDKRIIEDAYQSIPTDTMTAKSGVLGDALDSAMMKVIMGEDISVYEKAVKKWYKDGGQKMTDEANAWYKKQKQ